MEDKEKTTIVHGDQNIFRDNSRLVKVVVQGFQGSNPGGFREDINEQEVPEQAEVLESIALEADAQVVPQNPVEFPKLFMDAPSQAFHFPSDLTKVCVKLAVDSCYTGQTSQLAYVMIACFAYKLSDSLSSYKAFIRSLMLWGLIPYDESKVQQMANTMGIKVRTFNNCDFRKWGDELAEEKAICMEIGKIFESKNCWYRY